MNEVLFMKKSKFFGIIAVFVLITLGIALFFVMSSTQAKQDYFEGQILESSDDYVVIQIDSSYEKLIGKLGESVKIEKKDVVRECDFSNFTSDESVRVLYSGINSKEQKIEQVFAIYTLSELEHNSTNDETSS